MKKTTLSMAVGLALGLTAQLGTAQAPQLEEIVVTVQKRSENALDVPIALSVLDGNLLNDLRIDQFERLGNFVPGLLIQEQSVNNPGFVIRGITSDDGDSTIEPRVSVYQDGASIARSRGSNIALHDLERVTVAKGPQPTLFGRSALIGALNVIQNKAQDEFSARVEGGISGFDGNDPIDGTSFKGHINVPFTDTFYGRLAVYHKERDGYIENLSPLNDDLQGVNTQAARIALRFEPNDNLRFDLIGNYQQDDSPGTSFKSGVFLPTGGDLSPNSAAELNTFGNFEGGSDLGVDRDLWDITLLTEWTINDTFSLSSNTSYREFDSLEIFDPDGFGIDGLLFGENAEAQQFTQDLRLNFDAGGAVKAFAGVSYYTEDGFQRVPLQFDERAAAAIVGGFLLPSAPNDPTAEGLGAVLAGFGLNFPEPLHNEQFTNFNDSSAVDVYAETTWQVTERFELTAGLRWTFDDKTSGLQVILQSDPSILGPAAGSSAGTLFVEITPNQELIEASDDFNGGGWRIAGNYDLSDEVNLFATYSRGRRPDTIVTNPSIAAAAANEVIETLPEEEVDSFEVGAKALLLNKRLSVQGSLYYYSYTNFQSSIVDLTTGIADVINAGNASTEGAEVQFRYLGGERWSVFGNYGYNRARFDNFDDDGNPQDFAGNQFRLSPDHTVSVGADVAFNVPQGTLRFIPVYYFQSDVFFEDPNQPGIEQDGYGRLDAELRYEHQSEKWSISGQVDNILDEEYIIDAGNTGLSFGIPTFIAGPPRIWGITGAYNF